MFHPRHLNNQISDIRWKFSKTALFKMSKGQNINQRPFVNKLNEMNFIEVVNKCVTFFSLQEEEKESVTVIYCGFVWCEMK